MENQTIKQLLLLEANQKTKFTAKDQKNRDGHLCVLGYINEHCIKLEVIVQTSSLFLKTSTAPWALYLSITQVIVMETLRLSVPDISEGPVARIVLLLLCQLQMKIFSRQPDTKEIESFNPPCKVISQLDYTYVESDYDKEE